MPIIIDLNLFSGTIMLTAVNFVALLALLHIRVMATSSNPPTSMPTSLPTIVPTSMPSAGPGGNNPTYMPTFAPSREPTQALTDIPVGTAVVVFGVKLGYDGVDLSTWNANLATNNEVACAATTSTLNLPKSSCTVTDVVDTSTRRFLTATGFLRMLSTNPSVDVTTELSAPGSSTTDATSYVNTLNTAVASGSFQESVRTAATTKGATTLTVVTVPTSQSATTVGTPSTATATAAPTWAPTEAPGDSKDDPVLSVGAIVGIVCGGVIIIALVAYLMMRPKGNQVMVQTSGPAVSEGMQDTSKMSPVLPMVAITRPK